jgi:hypothetical protein
MEPQKGLGGAALIVSCGALALGLVVAIANGASNNGALVQRVSTLEVLAVAAGQRGQRIEDKIDALSPEDGKIMVLQEQVKELDATVAEQQARWQRIDAHTHRY